MLSMFYSITRLVLPAAVKDFAAAPTKQAEISAATIANGNNTGS